MYYLDDRVTPTDLVADQPDPVQLWHWRLSHHSVQKLRFVTHPCCVFYFFFRLWVLWVR